MLFLLYEDYLICRNLDFKTFEKPVDDKGGKQLVLGPWTTGLNHLPQSGGLDDQDPQVMSIFNAFLMGEREGQQRNMMR